MGKRPKPRAAKGKGKVKIKTEPKAFQQNVGENNRRGSKGKERAGWLDDLGQSLAQLGLRIKTVAADGNCFFRACSDQLQGDERRHLELRNSVVDFIHGHPDDFAPYMEDGEDFSSYCNRMREEGMWAGLHEQVAVSRLHGVELRIYQESQPCWTIHPDFPEIPKNASAWHLSYHEGQHYNSVRLADDFEAGPPRPIPVVDGKVVASSHLSAAAIEWEHERVSQVSRGTGCVDEGAIAQVLADAMGDVEQAVELWVERAAQEAADAEHGSENGEAGAHEKKQSPHERLCEQGLSQPVEMEAEAHPRLSEAEVHALGQLAAQQPASADVAPGSATNFKTEGADLKGVEINGKGDDGGKKPKMRQPCPCGSGKKYKKCCGSKKKPAVRERQQNSERTSPELSSQAASLYI